MKKEIVTDIELEEEFDDGFEEIEDDEVMPIEIVKKPNIFVRAKNGVKAIPDMTVKDFTKKVLLPVTVVAGGAVAIAGVVAKNKANDDDIAADSEYDDVVTSVIDIETTEDNN